MPGQLGGLLSASMGLAQLCTYTDQGTVPIPDLVGHTCYAVAPEDARLELEQDLATGISDT